MRRSPRDRGARRALPGHCLAACARFGRCIKLTHREGAHTNGRDEWIDDGDLADVLSLGRWARSPNGTEVSITVTKRPKERRMIR